MKIQFVFESLMCTYGSDLVLRNLIINRWPHLKEHMEALKNYEKCLPQLIVKIPFYETNDDELVRWMELTFGSDELIYEVPKYVDDAGLKVLIEYFEELNSHAGMEGDYTAILNTLKYKASIQNEDDDLDLYLYPIQRSN